MTERDREIEGDDLDAQWTPTGHARGGRNEQPWTAGDHDAASFFQRHEEQVVQAS